MKTHPKLYFRTTETNQKFTLPVVFCQSNFESYVPPYFLGTSVVIRRWWGKRVNLKTEVTRKQSTNKANQVFRKTNISYLLIRARTFVYQVVRNVCFSENLPCFIFYLPPSWDSPFCLSATDMILSISKHVWCCFWLQITVNDSMNLKIHQKHNLRRIVSSTKLGMIWNFALICFSKYYLRRRNYHLF